MGYYKFQSLILVLLYLHNFFILTTSHDHFDQTYTYIEPEATELNPFELSFKRSKCKNLPPGADLKDYRVDEKSNKCYSILYGEYGPCGANMRFFEKPGYPVYGICECEPETDRTLIYHEKSKQCHFIYTPAYCKFGYWLTLSQTTGRPTCVKNPCESLQTRNPFDDYVLYNNHCVKLGGKVEDCDDDETVNFERGKILPRCTVDFAGGGGAGGGAGGGGGGSFAEGPGIFKPVNKLKPCTPGSFRSLSGGCQANWIW